MSFCLWPLLLLLFFIKNKKKGRGDLSWRLLFGCDYSDILSVGFRIVRVKNSNEL